jgi:hypothetical protein
LVGKPKIFISQACKGIRHNPGMELKADGPNIRIATQTDFIWGFSSCRGDVCYRCKSTGSYYIQAHCDVILSDDGRNKDFVSILEMTSQETYKRLKKTGKNVVQCPNFTSSLRGKVFFPQKTNLNSCRS